MAVGDRIKVALETDVTAVQNQVDAGALEITNINDVILDNTSGNEALKVDVDDHETRISVLEEEVEDESVTAKSVIFDVANNYGGDWLGVRSVDFYLQGALITLTDTNFTAYASSSELTNTADRIFKSSLSKIGGSSVTQWHAGKNITTNTRFIIVFSTTIKFDEIVINNSHQTGANTNRGIKDVIINSSTSTITDTTYGAGIAFSSLLYSGVFNEHVSSNVEDGQSIPIHAPESNLIARVDGLEVDVTNLKSSVDVLEKSSGLDQHVMTRGISSKVTGLSGGETLPCNITRGNVYTKTSVLSSSGGGIYVPAGYMVHAYGFIKACGSGYMTFRIYRGSSVIGSQWGGDCPSSLNDTFVNGGCEAHAYFKETIGETYYLKKYSGSCDEAYQGNGNIATSYFTVEATKY